MKCDDNISAKVGTTSCRFAENVFWEFWTSGQASTVDAYSPVTKRVYSTSCSAAGEEITCSTDDGASVVFSKSAVDGYSQELADAYAAKADLGPPRDRLDEGSPAPPPITTAAPPPAASGCDPNYSGCLDPSLGDYDCQDGEGDGPGRTGEVEVLGDDIYRLDRDGDGIGCNGQ